MSLPREILDQLLSGYLDGVLSADEQRRVEELLRSNSEVAQELEELRSLRGSLRELYRAEAKPLGPKFAERVIESAVMQARAEGLSDDHPVVRLAEQPTTAEQPSRLPARRVAVMVSALAASILLGVVLTLPLWQGGPDEPLAERGPETTVDENARGTGADPREPSPVAGEGEVVAATQPHAEPADGERSGRSSTDTQLADRAVPERTGEGIDQPQSAPEMTPEQIAEATSPALSRDQIAAEQGSVQQGSVQQGSAQKPATEAGPETSGLRGGAVLVLDVRRTEQGRASGAVRSAMRAASLEPANQKRISDQIASVVTDSVDSVDDSGGTILYLQAPAKQLDRFFLSLVDDQSGIESVSMSLATDAPVMEMVQSLRSVDPTEVRHERSWQLRADGEQTIAALSRRLADRSFIPLDAGTASMGAASMGTGAAAPDSQGADVMSQVLVLVR